jgi:hypothetical protein
MPHLVRWNNELGEFGLLIVGPHVQKATDDAIKAKAQECHVSFSVPKGGSVQGADFNAIPHCFLFGHDGKCLHEGHPKDVEAKLRIAVGKALVEKAGLASGAAAGVTPLVDSLKRGQSPTAVLQKALPLQRSTNPDTADQAKKLVAALTEVGQRRVDEAAALAESEPLVAFDRLTRSASVFKGTPVADKANQHLTRLKNNREVMAEAKARPALEGIKKLDTALAPKAAEIDPKGADFHRAFVVPLRQMRTTLQQMKRNWPDAKATKEAAEIAEKYGVTVK